MDAFTHLLLLLDLASRAKTGEVTFCPSPALLALPSRTYCEGRLIKVNGTYLSSYMRKKYGTPQVDLPDPDPFTGE